MSSPKIYAFICTRSKDISNITKQYLYYLASCDIEVKLLVNQNSIFGGYKKAFEKVNPSPNDIIILSHDDIKITMPSPSFKKALIESTTKDTGFIGPAGTTYLGEDSVWWNHEIWSQGYHRGMVYHTDKKGEKLESTVYGDVGQVVVLDGLFLAARAKILEEVGLQKPEYLTEDWDFYDIHYTLTAHNKGYKNKTVAIPIIHYSRGELAGRDSWHKNREGFRNEHKEEFPIKC
jgi:hypothetical protein